MRIAIQKNQRGFTKRWIKYCEENSIEYILIDVFENKSFHQVMNCDAFYWNISHENHQDMKFGLQMIKAIESAGIFVFPSTEQLWHFDDKIAQNYFFRLNNIEYPETQIVYNLDQAKSILDNAQYPLIGKLRRGSASSNVFIIKSRHQGLKKVRKAFNRGYSLYNVVSRYRDVLKKSKTFNKWLKNAVKMLFRLLVPPSYAKHLPKEKGYFIFQEFVANSGKDTRVVVVGDKAVALQRRTRDNDFRASGSGLLEFPNDKLDKLYIQKAFEIVDKLHVNSMGIDFVKSLSGRIYAIEMSYGFPSERFLDGASGYWDKSLNFIKSEINLQEWMIELRVNSK